MSIYAYLIDNSKNHQIIFNAALYFEQLDDSELESEVIKLTINGFDENAEVDKLAHFVYGLPAEINVDGKGDLDVYFDSLDVSTTDDTPYSVALEFDTLLNWMRKERKVVLDRLVANGAIYDGEPA